MHIPKHMVDKLTPLMSASCPYRSDCKIEGDPDYCHCYESAYRLVDLVVDKGRDNVIKMIEEIPKVGREIILTYDVK